MSLDRQAIAEAIRHMSEEELRFLNHLIIDRLKLFSQARSTALLSKFAIGDRVTFTTPEGEHRTGVILRLNKKTASIRTDDGYRWNVHPSFLATVVEGSAVNVVKKNKLKGG